MFSYFHPTSSDYPDPTTNVSQPDRYVLRTDHCLICNDRSSGIHFGVSTCEACKAFFRRMNLSPYSIPAPCSPKPCEINTQNRNNCSSCRYDKCKRLGMDRENVIYGKPSKQQINSVYQQDSFVEYLKKFFYEFNGTFQTIYSIENKQQMDLVAQMVFPFFYQQTPTYQNEHLFVIVHRIFDWIFHSRKTPLLANYNLHLQAILFLWLFVYYYETFVFKQSLAHEKLRLLIQFLVIELKQLSSFSPDYLSQQIDFLARFTQLTNLLQEIPFDN